MLAVALLVEERLPLPLGVVHRADRVGALPRRAAVVGVEAGVPPPHRVAGRVAAAGVVLRIAARERDRREHAARREEHRILAGEDGARLAVDLLPALDAAMAPVEAAFLQRAQVEAVEVGVLAVERPDAPELAVAIVEQVRLPLDALRIERQRARPDVRELLRRAPSLEVRARGPDVDLARFALQMRLRVRAPDRSGTGRRTTPPTPCGCRRSAPPPACPRG